MAEGSVWLAWYEKLVRPLDTATQRRKLMTFEVIFFSSRLGFALVVFAFQVILSPFLPVPGPFYFPLNLAGVALVTAGTTIDLVCIRTFLTTGRGTPAPVRPPERILVDGPYRYVRNPMYLSLLISVLGFAIMLNSLLVAAAGFALLIAIHYKVVLGEEATLEKRFSEEYLQYKAKVPRWIPRIRAR